MYRFRGNVFSYWRRVWSQGWRGLPARNLRVTAANANLDGSGRATTSVFLFAGDQYYLLDDAHKAFLYPRSYPRAVSRFLLDPCLSSRMFIC